MSDDEKKLLGDHVSDVIERAGGGHVARAVEKVTGKPCGCAKRRQALNDWHRQVRGEKPSK